MASIYSRLSDAVKALVGVSEYADRRPYSGPEIDSAAVERARESLGGSIQPLPLSETRWYMADLELCQQMADAGDISKIGRLCRAMRRDGVISGLTSTRTAGMIALPKRWRGSQAQIEQLQSTNGTRTVFDEMVPPAELAKIAADAIKCGIGVGELCPMVGRKHPRLVALEPEFLRWKQAEGRWYFQSVGGSVPITPGDGRWVLHVEGGLLAPWNNGAWSALGRAYITKETALLARSNFSQKLANPARYAKTAQGATEVERAGFLEALIRWGFNTTFELPPGWEVGILETNGRGWEVFGTDIETANFESMVALAGQIVTTTGGSGFANADIHRTIRADLIKTSADALAHTINTQILPPWAYAEYGDAGLSDIARVEWDVKPPEDRKVEAEALEAVAKAVTALTAAFSADGIKVDAQEIASRFGVPVEMISKAEKAELEAESQQPQSGAKPQPSVGAATPSPKAGSQMMALASVGAFSAGTWEEDKHPRDDDGKFGSGGGGGGGKHENISNEEILQSAAKRRKTEGKVAEFISKHPSRHVLRNYTNSDYVIINDSLRSPEKYDDHVLSICAHQAEKTAEVLRDAKKAGLAHEGAVIRGEQSDSLPEHILKVYREADIGTEIQFDSFLSTSTSPRVANDFGDITLKLRQRSGVAVSAVSEHQDEDEILLPPGSRFKIMSRKTTGGRLELELHEL